MTSHSLIDELLAIELEFYTKGESIRSEIGQFLSLLSEDRSSFFSSTIQKKQFTTTYYPFVNRIDQHLGALELLFRKLGSVLEKGEQQMACDLLTQGGLVVEGYWEFANAIHTFLEETEGILRRSSDALPLPDIRANTLRLSYQADRFCAFFSKE